MTDDSQAAPRVPNEEAIRAIADRYCIQRDPRATARIIGDVLAECARRLCEGDTVLYGCSLECEVFMLAHDWPELTRANLIGTIVRLIELTAILDLGPAVEASRP